MAKDKFERRLLYVGPVSSFSIMAAKGADDKVVPDDSTRPLITGEVYDDLPKGHPVIENLIAHKLLVTPVDEVSDPLSPETVVPESGTASSNGDGRKTTRPAVSDKSAK